MQPARAASPTAGIVRFYNLASPGGGFRDDVLQGLAAKQKSIPPKYFHDARGDELYAAVCALPGYYAMRTELSLLRSHGAEIAQLLGPACQLIEFGAGLAARTALLVDAAAPPLYMPIELDEAQLRKTCAELSLRFPALHITGLIADPARGLALPDIVGVPLRKKAAFLPGAAIGRFTPFEAQAFLAMTRRLVGTGGVMLVGVDLTKDWNILGASCNDGAGVIAAYQLNLLDRINRELGADFQPRRFRYNAWYDEAHNWVETHLESEYSQFARVAGQRVDFQVGETIHTGIACKYDIAEFQDMARQAKFQSVKVWADPHNLYALFGLIAV